MAEISASTVKALRDKTGAGIMDCKSALAECNGDLEAAIDYLRKKGLAAASKKSGRVAAEGVVACYKEGNKATLVELNSETDFVARNEKFQQLANRIAKAASAFGEDVDAFLKTTPEGFSKTVSEEIIEHIAIIGENMALRRIASLEVSNGIVASYVHNCIAEDLGKIGVLIAIESDAEPEKLQPYGKQLAMHIAAAKPEALRIEDMDPTLVAKEKEIIKDQIMSSGKPEAVAQKMLEGMMRKFFEESVLLEQIFMIDNKTKVKDLIDQISQELGASVKIKSYVRFSLGEGIDTSEKE